MARVSAGSEKRNLVSASWMCPYAFPGKVDGMRYRGRRQPTQLLPEGIECGRMYILARRRHVLLSRSRYHKPADRPLTRTHYMNSTISPLELRLRRKDFHSSLSSSSFSSLRNTSRSRW